MKYAVGYKGTNHEWLFLKSKSDKNHPHGQWSVIPMKFDFKNDAEDARAEILDSPNDHHVASYTTDVQLAKWKSKIVIVEIPDVAMRQSGKAVAPLSLRIKRRMKQCKICGGKGWRIVPDIKGKFACPDCSDWRVTLRGVKLLEEIARVVSDFETWRSDRLGISDLLRKAGIRSPKRRKHS